ncbi:LysR substrate-binding domain-containing protein [Leifsonia sp. NPDC058292]|uniref:LysR substrate-binding domain-containing protein n=1 Tax=Leifsonia sp. NPDC058292 TaxID=3346428 RepID=UPI0036D82C9A
MHDVRVRIDEVTHFLALAADGHVAHAAEALGVSQSTLSRSVGRLEAEMGVELFDRTKGRFELNRYGQILLAHASRALAEFETARSRIDALRDPSAGTVSIAYVSSFGSWLIPRLVGDYRALFPDIRFVLNGGTADTVLEALRGGAADIAILSPDPRDPEIDWRALTSERLALGVPDAHPFAARTDGVEVSELEDLEFLALKPGAGLRGIADSYFAVHGVVPNVVLEVTELSTLRALVRAGVGVALLPELTEDAGLRLVPLRDEATRVIGLATNRSRSPSAAAQQFARFVREEWA